MLGGADTPAAVLDHLTQTWGGRAELQEHVSGQLGPGRGQRQRRRRGRPVTRVGVRSDLALEVSRPARSRSRPGCWPASPRRPPPALDRERLRTQAAQAEALAEGNRMRTALLAAVSHDLRTPLASIKASVSSLRQTDVAWTAADEAALLATIEENADRLDALIGNLLDMSRLHTGSLQPFLRPTAIDEVAPIALRGLDAPASLRLEVPDGLPLVLRRPGPAGAGAGQPVLQRAAPLAARAGRRPCRPSGRRRRVVLEVIDHGPGVPDELKARIFEPFQRLDEPARHGVGLGLAVAKGFTEAMGGGDRRGRHAGRRADDPGHAAGRAQGRRVHAGRRVCDPGAGHRRRAVDPARAADQPHRAELRGQHRQPTARPGSPPWPASAPT